KLVTLRLTGFVTPSMVSSPSTATGRSPSNATLVDLKVMVGYFSTLKKRSALRIASRRLSQLLTEVASIVTSTDAFFAARSSVILPLDLRKLPSWVEKPR